MRIRNKAHLRRLHKDQRLSGTALKQIERSLASSHESDTTTERTPERQRQTKPVHPTSTPNSPGELSVARALEAAFGRWEKGGELVQELVVAPPRRYRVDFALPRWRLYVEVLGWRNHGFELNDHHRDCQRLLFLSARDWLPFHVTHAQALHETHQLIEALEAARQWRNAIPRQAITLRRRQTAKSQWWVLEQIRLG